MSRLRFRLWMSITIATLCILCCARDIFSQGSAGHDTLPNKKDSKSKLKNKNKSTNKPQPKAVPKVTLPILPHRVNPQPKLERQNKRSRKRKPSTGGATPNQSKRDPRIEAKDSNPQSVPGGGPTPEKSQLRGESKLAIGQAAQIEPCTDRTKELLSPAKAGQALLYLRRGRKSWFRTDYEHAIPELTTSLRNNPCLSEAYYIRGLIYKENGNIEAAIQDYSNAIKLNPTVEAYNNRGVLYSKEKDFNSAIKDYSAAINLQSEWPALSYANRGSAYYSLGYREISFDDIGSAMEYFYKAIEDLDKGIHDLNKATEQHIELELKPANPYLARGRANYQVGNYDAAISDCDIARQLDSFISGAQECSDSAKTEKKVYADRVKNEPKNAEGYYERGNAYLFAKKFDKAIADYEQAIAQYDEAIKKDSKVSKGGFKFAYLNCGIAHYSNKEYDAAIVAFNKIIGPDSDPNVFDENYLDVYYKRGLAYAAKKDFDNAIADYTEAIKRALTKGSVYSNAYYKRGIAFLKKGNMVAAEQSLLEYLEKSSGANVLYAYLDLAAIYDQMSLNEADLEKKAAYKQKAIDMRTKAKASISVTQSKEENTPKP